MRIRSSEVALTLRLYIRMQLAHLRASVEHRGDFAIGLISSTLYQLSYLVFLFVFFSHITMVGGWNVWQIALLYGLMGVPRGLVEMFADGGWALKELLNMGTFDRLLVRPAPVAVQVLSSLGGIHGLGQLVPGTILVAVGGTLGGVEWTWRTLLIALITVLSGGVILASLTLAINMIGFIEPSVRTQIPVAYLSLADFAKFPLDAFPVVIRLLVLTVAPFGFCSYFPALVLLRKDVWYGWIGYCTPAIAAVVTGCVAMTWTRAVNRYQGVGH